MHKSRCSQILVSSYLLRRFTIRFDVLRFVSFTQTPLLDPTKVLLFEASRTCRIRLRLHATPPNKQTKAENKANLYGGLRCQKTAFSSLQLNIFDHLSKIASGARSSSLNTPRVAQSLDPLRLSTSTWARATNLTTPIGQTLGPSWDRSSARRCKRRPRRRRRMPRSISRRHASKASTA